MSFQKSPKTVGISSRILNEILRSRRVGTSKSSWLTPGRSAGAAVEGMSHPGSEFNPQQTQHNAGNVCTNPREKPSDSRRSERWTVFTSQSSRVQTMPTQPVTQRLDEDHFVQTGCCMAIPLDTCALWHMYGRRMPTHTHPSTSVLMYKLRPIVHINQIHQ